MKRGDVVLAVGPRDYGKPRPSVVVQSDLFVASHDSVVVCLFTSELKAFPLFRLLVHPSKMNGLRETSQIMTDKILAIPKKQIWDKIGVLEEDIMAELNSCLRLFLGLSGG